MLQGGLVGQTPCGDAIGNRLPQLGKSENARIGDVLRMVVVEGMTPVAIGLAAGLLGAVALSDLLSKLIYQVKPTDPATFGTVSVLLAAVAFVACAIPAYRATRVDPIKALREE